MSQFEEYSDLLSMDIEIAICSEDENLINEIRSYWDNESWESIKSKFDTEGSTWVVWWQDGVNAYARKNRINYNN